MKYNLNYESDSCPDDLRIRVLELQKGFSLLPLNHLINESPNHGDNYICSLMQQSPFKSSINYGAMYGLACFAMFLLIYWSGTTPLGMASWLAVWIPPLFIYLSIKHYRDNILGGAVGFGDAFRAGLITAASGALLFSLMVLIFGKVIDPMLIDDYKEYLLSQLEISEGAIKGMLGENAFEASVEETKNLTLGRQSFSEFANKSVGGLIYSLIAAAILKRKPQTII